MVYLWWFRHHRMLLFCFSQKGSMLKQFHQTSHTGEKMYKLRQFSKIKGRKGVLCSRFLLQYIVSCNPHLVTAVILQILGGFCWFSTQWEKNVLDGQKWAYSTLFQGATACFLCWPLDIWLDVSGSCACFFFFLGCFAMDSDCSLRGMPSAEWDSGRVHVLSAPLSYICWAWLLPLPATLDGNIQHSNDL